VQRITAQSNLRFFQVELGILVKGVISHTNAILKQTEKEIIYALVCIYIYILYVETIIITIIITHYTVRWEIFLLKDSIPHQKHHCVVYLKLSWSNTLSSPIQFRTGTS